MLKVIFYPQQCIYSQLTYQFFSLAEYTEVRSGNCTSVSVDDCELIATIVGKSFATTTNTKGIYPAGCYTYTQGSQVSFNRNEDDQPSNCTTSRVCFCVPEMGKQRSIVFPCYFVTSSSKTSLIFKELSGNQSYIRYQVPSERRLLCFSLFFTLLQ